MKISFFGDGSCTVLNADAAWRFDPEQTMRHLPMLSEIASEHDDARLMEFLSKLALVKDQHASASVNGSVFAEAPVFEIHEPMPAPAPLVKRSLWTRLRESVGLN